MEAIAAIAILVLLFVCLVVPVTAIIGVVSALRQRQGKWRSILVMVLLGIG